MMHMLFSVCTVCICPSHILHVTTFLLNFYCDSIIMLLAQVYARICMCVCKLIIKVLVMFKTFPSNIITFFNLTLCKVC